MDLRRRDRELTEIAKSIASLAELFKDLSALVIDQGTLLDSVEYNIEQTAVQMSEAVRELDVATRSVSGSYRRRAYPRASYQLIIDFSLRIWPDTKRIPGVGSVYSSFSLLYSASSLYSYSNHGGTTHPHPPCRSRAPVSQLYRQKCRQRLPASWRCYAGDHPDDNPSLLLFIVHPGSVTRTDTI